MKENKRRKMLLASALLQVIFSENILAKPWHRTRRLEPVQLTNNLSNAIVSESSLKKDWLRPEEDEAWQNL
jgi:RNase adaptor protein for sRNA GlmZ degradation